MASRLEDINHQLVLLTTILVGSDQDDKVSCSHGPEVKNTNINNGESFQDDENSETYQEGFGHPSYLDNNDAYREVSVFRELQFVDEHAIETEHDDGSGLIAAVQSKGKLP